MQPIASSSEFEVYPSRTGVAVYPSRNRNWDDGSGIDAVVLNQSYTIQPNEAFPSEQINLFSFYPASNDLFVSTQQNEIRLGRFRQQPQLAASNSDAFTMSGVKTGLEVTCCRKHSARVTALACSPCGNYIASAAQDCNVVIWHAQSPPHSNYAVFKEHSASVTTLCFIPSPSATSSSLLVASGSSDGTVLVWDSVEQSIIHFFRMAARIQLLAVSPLSCGVLLVHATGQPLNLWALDTRTEQEIEGEACGKKNNNNIGGSISGRNSGNPSPSLSEQPFRLPPVCFFATSESINCTAMKLVADPFSSSSSSSASSSSYHHPSCSRDLRTFSVLCAQPNGDVWRIILPKDHENHLASTYKRAVSWTGLRTLKIDASARRYYGQPSDLQRNNNNNNKIPVTVVVCKPPPDPAATTVRQATGPVAYSISMLATPDGGVGGGIIGARVAGYSGAAAAGRISTTTSSNNNNSSCIFFYRYDDGRCLGRITDVAAGSDFDFIPLNLQQQQQSSNRSKSPLAQLLLRKTVHSKTPATLGYVVVRGTSSLTFYALSQRGLCDCALATSLTMPTKSPSERLAALSRQGCCSSGSRTMMLASEVGGTIKLFSLKTSSSPTAPANNNNKAIARLSFTDADFVRVSPAGSVLRDDMLTSRSAIRIRAMSFFAENVEEQHQQQKRDGDAHSSTPESCATLFAAVATQHKQHNGGGDDDNDGDEHESSNSRTFLFICAILTPPSSLGSSSSSSSSTVVMCPVARVQLPERINSSGVYFSCSDVESIRIVSCCTGADGMRVSLRITLSEDDSRLEDLVVADVAENNSPMRDEKGACCHVFDLVSFSILEPPPLSSLLMSTKQQSDADATDPTAGALRLLVAAQQAAPHMKRAHCSVDDICGGGADLEASIADLESLMQLAAAASLGPKPEKKGTKQQEAEEPTSLADTSRRVSAALKLTLASATTAASSSCSLLLFPPRDGSPVDDDGDEREEKSVHHQHEQQPAAFSSLNGTASFRAAAARMFRLRRQLRAVKDTPLQQLRHVLLCQQREAEFEVLWHVVALRDSLKAAARVLEIWRPVQSATCVVRRLLAEAELAQVALQDAARAAVAAAHDAEPGSRLKHDDAAQFSAFKRLALQAECDMKLAAVQQRVLSAQQQPFWLPSSFTGQERDILCRSVPSQQMRNVGIIAPRVPAHIVGIRVRRTPQCSATSALPESRFGEWRQCIVVCKLEIIGDTDSNNNNKETLFERTAILHAFDFSSPVERAAWRLERRLRRAVAALPGVESVLCECILTAEELLDLESSSSSRSSPSFYVCIVVSLPDGEGLKPLTPQHLVSEAKKCFTHHDPSSSAAAKLAEQARVRFVERTLQPMRGTLRELFLADDEWLLDLMFVDNGSINTFASDLLTMNESNHNHLVLSMLSTAISMTAVGQTLSLSIIDVVTVAMCCCFSAVANCLEELLSLPQRSRTEGSSAPPRGGNKPRSFAFESLPQSSMDLSTSRPASLESLLLLQSLRSRHMCGGGGSVISSLELAIPGVISAVDDAPQLTNGTLESRIRERFLSAKPAFLSALSAAAELTDAMINQ